MPINNLTITAPALGLSAPVDMHAQLMSPMQAFGAVVWLWGHVQEHRDLPLRALPSLVMAPIKHQQYILACAAETTPVAPITSLLAAGQDLKPVAYVAWANLSAEAESRYLNNPATGLRPEDWTSGERMWFTDFFAPFGHSHAFKQAICQCLPHSCARYLHHRGNERGMRVKTYRGAAVTPDQAHAWWQARPMQALVPTR